MNIEYEFLRRRLRINTEEAIEVKVKINVAYTGYQCSIILSNQLISVTDLLDLTESKPDSPLTEYFVAVYFHRHILYRPSRNLSATFRN
jgi:hypothetical protein